ncbi:MAG: hypothetical protein PHP95_07215 [Desulfuromonadaceae bacterium]|nr:hypothetical protein [Desulfuromonadaceae bacterium]MDD2848231.1 hypothetical protein [Desulfuromonadaceae bacterium]MDD4130602.1 hypothetical protein [Desulfuromonadaceae bacterium]
MQKILLKDSLPDFAYELKYLLVRENMPDLANQIVDMQIDVERCFSGEDYFTMICTGLQPLLGWGTGQPSIVLTPHKGTILLNVIGNDIISVEIFFRSDIQERFLQQQSVPS